MVKFVNIFMRMSLFRVITFYLILSGAILSATDLTDFATEWSGYESLSSPSLNYQVRQFYLDVRKDENELGSLVYRSNSDFIYNGYLDWAKHSFKYDKNSNSVSFGRRFNTPLGIIGTKEIIYQILDFNEERLVLQHTSIDSSTTHKMSISAVALSLIEGFQPEIIKLKPNYPNPFNPRTLISLDVFENSDFMVYIYDSRGVIVKEIFNGSMTAGSYKFLWNGINETGSVVSSGIYFCKVIKENRTISSRKMILLK